LPQTRSKVPQDQIRDCGYAGKNAGNGNQRDGSLARQRKPLQCDGLRDAFPGLLDLLLRGSPLRGQQAKHLPLTIANLAQDFENLLFVLLLIVISVGYEIDRACPLF